jgi:hypothetical protein|tara:strand:- start:15 stop:5987 length:5973 start_codon:yes stop_codon:yes gene_type:complete
MRKILLILLLPFSVYCQTDVSGIVNEATTWSISGSPYNITADVVFNSGLTIEAGVSVNLNGGHLRVKEKLIANGTLDNNISFAGFMGVWLDQTSVTFDDNGNYVEGTHLSHCNFNITEATSYSVFIDNGTAFIDNSVFDGQYGIVLDYVGNDNTGSKISNSQFFLNGGQAIKIASFSTSNSKNISNNVVANNVFDNSNVILGSYKVNSFNNIVKHNIFKNCNTALTLGWGDVVDGVKNAQVYNNIFSNNGTGIIIGSRPGNNPSAISHNLFLNNSNAIRAEGTYHNQSLVIKNNIIVNSADGDITLDDEAGAIISKNLIYNSTPARPGPNQSLISFDSGYQDSDSKNNVVENNTLVSTFQNIITSFYGGNSINNNNIYGSDFNLLVNATGNGSDTEFSNNSVNSEILSLLEDRIYDSSDNVDVYNVVVSSTTTERIIENPILPPQKTIKVISGNDLQLTWQANPESDIAGYRLYYGNPTVHSYDNFIDLGNVSSYTFQGGAQYNNVAITAYDAGFESVDSTSLIYNSKQVLGNESWYSIFQTNPKITISATKTDVAEGSSTTIKFDLDQAPSEDMTIQVDFLGNSILGTDYEVELQDVLFEDDFNSLDESSSLSSYYFILPQIGDGLKLDPTLSESNGNKFLTYEVSDENFKYSFATQWNHINFSSATNSGDKIKLSFKHKWEGDVESYRLEGFMYNDTQQLKSGSENEWVSFEKIFDAGEQSYTMFVIYVFNKENGANQYSKLHIDDVKIECISCINTASSQSIAISKLETSKQFKILAKDDFIDESTETINLEFTLSGSGELSAESLSLNLLDSKTTISKTENPFPGLSQGDVSWGDFDNDGDKDVALMGVSNISGAVTAIYENKGPEGFVNTNQNFERVIDGTLEWADLNKDGFIDLIVSGYNGNGPSTKVYLNTEAFYFLEDESFNIPDLYATELAFGDLDNDGDIDYLIVGYDASDNIQRFYGFKKDSEDGFDIVNSNISPNIGDDILIFDKDSDGDNDIISNSSSKTNTLYSGSNGSINYFALGNGGNIVAYKGNGPMAGVEQLTKNGYISVGDFDNNGYNDFVLTGEDSNGSGLTKLYLGNQDGVSETDNYDLEGLRDSTVEFIDYDKDGDLDIFLTGVSDAGGNQTILYEVDVTNKSNQAPSKITSLNYENMGDGNVKLSWEAPEDDFSSDLGYNIRIGTTPGGSELSNTESNLETGDRLINKAPPTFNSFYIRQLDPGKYYWSVQAIDGGYKGGVFSEEQSFTLTYDWKILNQGGIIDYNISGRSKPILKLVDLDNDEDLDLLISGDTSEGVNVLNYDGTKFITGDIYFGGGAKEIAVGDIDNDGIIDKFFGLYNGSLMFYWGDVNIQMNNDILYDPIGKITDINNDGENELILIGKSSLTSSAKLKLYVYNINFSFAPFWLDKQDYSSQLKSLLNSSYDLGDFDNDKDIDLIISGFSTFDGIETILYENITEPGGDLSLLATNNNIVSIKNGSTDFIDFDSDGDLDIVMSGTSYNSDIFEVYLNNGSITWPRIDVGLDGIRDTKVDLGDFDGDGYTDLLYSGTQTGYGKVTKLSEFDPNNFTYSDSEFNVSDIQDATVEFGDIEGDGDLDFVIAGTSSSSGENILRTYINYRNDSYDVLNPPIEGKYDVLIKHDELNTTMKNSSSVEVTAIQLIYQNNLDIDLVKSIESLSKLNDDQNLTIVKNNNKVIIYGDITKRFSSIDSYQPILVHKTSGNILSEIVSVAGYSGERLKSLTSRSSIYEEGFVLNSFSGNNTKILSRSGLVDNNIEEMIVNQRPDMPFVLSEEVLNPSNNIGKTEVLLSWNQAYDDNTPSEGLTYSVRVGTSPGGEDVLSSNATSEGILKSSSKGNAEHNTSWKLALNPGKYYWSVQSIDNSFNGSLFSAENDFEIGSSGSLSVDKIENIKTSIYPNPVKRDFTVTSDDLTIDNISIYNLSGQLMSFSLITRSSNTVAVNIEHFLQGVYVLVVESGDFKVAKKIIKD